MLLNGIFPPITTPFYPDGKVYFKKIEHNVERYSKTPAAGLVVLGSTGEAVMLSDDERREVLKVAREAAAPNKVLIAGTGIESAVETLRLTEFAAELGYDAALVRTPHFYKKLMQPPNLLAFYRTVADSSPLPVLIYNVPPFTGYDMPAELVIELAGHPNIIGIKESGGDVEKVRRMVEGTRHVKRSATVTETFDAVTPRMLKASTGGNGQGGELVQVTALGAGKPSSSGVNVVSGIKTRQKEVGFQVLAGAGPEAGTVAAGGGSRRGIGLRGCGSDRLLRDLRRLERRRCRTGAPEAGANHQCGPTRGERARYPGYEVWNGSERVLRWSRPLAAVATHGRSET